MLPLPPFRSRLSWTQCHLGKDDSGDLCVILPQHPPSDLVIPDKPYILGLPDEILLQILYIISVPLQRDIYGLASDTVSTYGDLAAMALVCHRFNRLSTPCLYAYIHCLSGHSMFRPGRIRHVAARARLHETLQKRDDLRKQCHSVVYRFGYNCPTNSGFESIAADYALWLARVEEATLSGSFYEPEVGIAAAGLLSTMLQTATQLRSLTIFMREDGSMTLRTICKVLHNASPSLVNLTIRSCPCVVPPPYLRLEDLTGIRKTSIRTLKLDSFTERPDILASFVAWIDQLEHFSMVWDPDYYRHWDWSLSTIAGILAPHQQHLRSIKLGKMTSPGLGSFDVSVFPKLEHLTLHADDLEGVDATKCPQLCAPGLMLVVKQ